ncbi:hypothetical protein G6M70_01825 [Agrobacterium tumefaciens]|uniref:hypothetical protein n=1 Tax=Agrobacterium tumefaciens TaxID=358 RepID=UPI0015741D46|nr:hypothetical protein [Agrobacterium tumefaciens]NSZ00848.1 hypothetical protein [Agrobacterium tumefaciens]NSZ37540.1 hypothetical protein [Agrobacterium tumefaciens]NTB22178.1 hypothetical protein [Agrobacterium tumefaciens]NTB31046.1 hypothetical protein [Agrobacterium tumefaciens]NTB32458.1 hypothetical protein [Agrobacterium tumefaciens]
MVDHAILRAGRLVRHVVISLPDEHARTAIFTLHLHESLTDGDHHDFTAATGGLSGAEIQKIVSNARRSARRRRGPITRGNVILHLPFLACMEKVLRERFERVKAIQEETRAAVVRL